MLRSSLRLALASGGLLALAACGGNAATAPSYQQELFNSGPSPFAHSFDASVDETCEAARRALLSQGFQATSLKANSVDASKNYQPSEDAHVVLSFHVVCTAGENATNTSIAYVNAVQDGYSLKKSDTSATVGLSLFGSLSLPILSNTDSMVRVSSETVPAGKFYTRFFKLVRHYLETVPRSTPVVAAAVTSELLEPLPVVPSPAVTSTPNLAQTLPPTTATETSNAQPTSKEGVSITSVSSPGYQIGETRAH